MLWQDTDADVRGQCAVGEGENLSSLTLVRTRGLSDEVLTYTHHPPQTTLESTHTARGSPSKSVASGGATLPAQEHGKPDSLTLEGLGVKWALARYRHPSAVA